MLTAEERQRIEEEERKRVAEEKYRAEVRAQLNGPTLTVVQKPTPIWKIGLGFVCAAVVILAVIGMVSSSRGSANPGINGFPVTSGVRYVPVSEKILSGQIAVKSSGYVQYRIRIAPDARDARLSGQITAAGGSGNDIQIVLANEEEFANWINGHEARLYYSTGKKTADHFNLRLAPGVYILAFNNKFSLLNDKVVSGDVQLDYSRAEMNP